MADEKDGKRLGLFSRIAGELSDRMFNEVPIKEDGEDEQNIDAKLQELKRREAASATRSSPRRTSLLSPSQEPTEPEARREPSARPPGSGVFASRPGSHPFGGPPLEGPASIPTPQPPIPLLPQAEADVCVATVDGWLDPTKYKALDAFRRLETKFARKLSNPEGSAQMAFDSLAEFGMSPADVKVEAEQVMSVLRGRFQVTVEGLETRENDLSTKRAVIEAEVKQTIEAHHLRLDTLQREMDALSKAIEMEAGKTAKLDQIQQAESGRIAATRALFEQLVTERMAQLQKVMTAADAVPPSET